MKAIRNDRMKMKIGKYKIDTDWACPVCNNRRFKKIEKHNSRLSLFQNKVLITCGECSLKSVFPMPSEEELDKFNNFYWNHCSPNENSSEYQYLQALYRYKYLKSHIQIFDGLNILEIGSGHPFFYDLLKSDNDRVNYSIVEPDQNIQNELRSKGIAGIYSTWKRIESVKFDIILLLHVIEHFIYPVIYLKEIAQLLKKDGYMFIEIPNQDDVFKDDLGAHLLVFNAISLERIFKEINMNIIDIKTVGQSIWELKRLRKNVKLKLKMMMRKYFPQITNIKHALINRILKQRENEKSRRKNIHHYFDSYNNHGRWIRAIIQKTNF